MTATTAPPRVRAHAPPTLPAGRLDHYFTQSYGQLSLFRFALEKDNHCARASLLPDSARRPKRSEGHRLRRRVRAVYTLQVKELWETVAAPAKAPVLVVSGELDRIRGQVHPKALSGAARRRTARRHAVAVSSLAALICSARTAL